jgi:hypothetical protein
MQFLPFYLLFNMRTSLHPLFNQFNFISLFVTLILFYYYVKLIFYFLFFFNIYFYLLERLLHAMTNTTD